MEVSAICKLCVHVYKSFHCYTSNYLAKLVVPASNYVCNAFSLVGLSECNAAKKSDAATAASR